MKSVLEADAIQQDICGAVNQSAFTLFYGQFKAAAPCVRHLITEAERRASTSLTEYTTLVQDLQSNYLSCRMQLLQPSVKTAVSQLGTVHTRDHMRLVRAGYAFLPHVCEDEYQMQSLFFSENDGEAPGHSSGSSHLSGGLSSLSPSNTCVWRNQYSGAVKGNTGF